MENQELAGGGEVVNKPKITRRGHEPRKQEAINMWREWVKLYPRVSAAKIASMTINKKTGKPYTPHMVWNVIRRIERGQLSID